MWVMGLGLATVYLIKQKMTIQGQIANATAKFEGSEPEPPQTADGITSATVRRTLATSDDRFRDVNADLPKEDVSIIARLEDQMLHQVSAFESAGEKLVRGLWLEPSHEA